MLDEYCVSVLVLVKWWGKDDGRFSRNVDIKDPILIVIISHDSSHRYPSHISFLIID